MTLSSGTLYIVTKMCYNKGMMTREEFLETVKKLTQAAEAYYVTDIQIMSDAEYDVLLEQVQLAADGNGWFEADALFSKVAAGFSGSTTVKHAKPMLSMAKVKTMVEVEKFLKTVPDVVFEPKLDGLAVALTYMNGLLVTAATRGDGDVGENITETVKLNTIKNLPHSINIKTDVEVRGELYMTNEDFKEANKERIRRTGKPFANSRNATAGIIRNENEENPYAKLSFAVYDSVGLKVETYKEAAPILRENGFLSASDLLPKINGEIPEQITQFGLMRETLDYPTDGVVLKANHYSVRETLGEASKHPHWAKAYKYEDSQTVTTLRSVELSIGRTGALTLTGVFDPVELEGTTVSKATLNNVQYVKDNNIRVGGQIIVQKANMIIPQVIAGINNESLLEYAPSSKCPQCGESLDTTTSVVWRCLNPECSTLQAINYWCSSSAMDIDGLSETLIIKMLEQGLISNATDLYILTPEKMSNLVMKEGVSIKGEKFLFGMKRAEQLHKNIQGTKTQPLWRVLTALNIRHVGVRLGKVLEKRYKNIDSLLSTNVEEMMLIEGIAKEKATAITEGLKQRADIIPVLKTLKFTLKPEETSSEKAEWIEGKKFVITGTLNSYARSDLVKKLEALGGSNTDSVSSKTGLLIVGDNAGSKKSKAEQLGVPILNEEELIKLLAG